MQNKKSHTIISKAAVVALMLLTLITTGCERKDLWLRPENATIQIAIYDVRLDLMWGVDWQAKWQYIWDEELYGPVGYTTPSYVRASIYDLDESLSRINYYTKNFPATGGRVSLKTGSWYDMLFYSAGTEYTIFNQATDYGYYDATTRTSDYTPVINRGSVDAADGTEETKTYTGYKQPDELFGTFLENLEISSDPTVYEQTYDEETGETVYLYSIDAEMQPYSFIYMIQVMVINNQDSIGDIISLKRATSNDTIRYAASGMTMTGLSRGVDLFTRTTFDDACSVTIDESDIRYLQRRDSLVLPSGEVTKGDIFAARMLTWGLPGISPYEEWAAVQAGTSTHTYADRNKLGIKFYLRNGYTHVQVFDVTDQMRAHPCGGVITVVIDAKASVTQDELNQKQTESGGGFNANVENWQNEVNADVTI